MVLLSPDSSSMSHFSFFFYSDNKHCHFCLKYHLCLKMIMTSNQCLSRSIQFLFVEQGDWCREGSVTKKHAPSRFTFTVLFLRFDHACLTRRDVNRYAIDINRSCGSFGCNLRRDTGLSWTTFKYFYMIISIVLSFLRKSVASKWNLALSPLKE